jgi:hypothetical protein
MGTEALVRDDGVEIAKDKRALHKTQRKPERRRRRRVQLDLLPDVYDRIVQIQLINGLDSVREVFRQAFRLYEWYTTRRSEGWAVQLVHSNGDVVFVDLGLDGERPVRYRKQAQQARERDLSEHQTVGA